MVSATALSNAATAEALSGGGVESAGFRASSSQPRTIWGLDPVQLHSRYWAGFGVQVVRQGEPSELVRHAELYLLTDPRSLPLFKLSEVIDTLNWIEPTILCLQVRDTRIHGYREKVITDARDRFVRFERIYDSTDRRTRMVLTPDREIAQLWQQAGDPLTGWRRLRKFVPRTERYAQKLDGLVFDRVSDGEIGEFLKSLVDLWPQPGRTISRASAHWERGVWYDPSSRIDPSARIVGPVWVGAGRQVQPGEAVVGPAVMWDDPQARPQEQEIQWLTIEPMEPPDEPEVKQLYLVQRVGKRLFDLGFSLIVLAMTLWLYPLIMLAIWLEDGRPFFFGHLRESRGGREFRCWKFRSMRKDAEQIKQKLIAEGKNQADGAQFYMDDDPRLTKVGKFLRKTNLDELPQFFNVIAGHMSVVGPRPSPRKENQFCPAWREARLSVRPGITGLWQTRRTRQAGSDFQEWIKYDIEYVENISFRLDLKIIYLTLSQIVRKGTH